MDEDKHVQRRRVLLGLAVGGGAVAAISALGVGIVKMVSGDPVALATRRSLDMQRQYGWDFGARGAPLVFDGVAEGPFVREQLQSLGQVMAPSGQGPNAKYAVPTLVESLLAVPTASLPDPEDGQPRPDGAPFRRLLEVLLPIQTPAMTRAYRAGEALARLAGWKQGLAVLADMPGPKRSPSRRAPRRRSSPCCCSTTGRTRTPSCRRTSRSPRSRTTSRASRRRRRASSRRLSSCSIARAPTPTPRRPIVSTTATTRACRGSRTWPRTA
jgi:hypothetical protein